jgi:hypothetical protein
MKLTEIRYGGSKNCIVLAHVRDLQAGCSVMKLFFSLGTTAPVGLGLPP